MPPMKLSLDKNWFERNLERDGDFEVGVGALELNRLNSRGKDVMDIQDLDCGIATPEGYDEAKREALHVLNVNLIGDVNRNRVLKFACARVLHFHKHLPQGSSQRILFDLRGQRVSDKNLKLVRETIKQESVEHGIHVTIEFLTN